MPSVSPYRIAAYVAMVAVLLLVGWNSLKSEGPSTASLPGRAGIDGAASAGVDGGSGSGVETGMGSGADAAGGGLLFAAGDRSIVVDVSGAVNRPGVYRFRQGQRVIDAIRRAGGASRGAFAAGINRAALLSDGQQVVVPVRAGAAVAGAAGTGPVATPAGQAAAPDVPISLGTATQVDLEQIEGIGPVTATAILEFRDSQGGVSSIDELDQVTGIGPVTMEALKSRLQP